MTDRHEFVDVSEQDNDEDGVTRWAVCSCGWESDDYPLQREAVHEYVRHRMNANAKITESDRTRAAVVKALRYAAVTWSRDGVHPWHPVTWLHNRADEIEKGADW